MPDKPNEKAGSSISLDYSITTPVAWAAASAADDGSSSLLLLLLPLPPQCHLIFRFRFSFHFAPSYNFFFFFFCSLPMFGSSADVFAALSEDMACTWRVLLRLFFLSLGGFARLFIISRCPPLPFLGLLLLLSACHWNTVFLSQSLCVCLFVSLFGHPKTGRHHHHHSQSSELWTKPCVLARWRLI